MSICATVWEVLTVFMSFVWEQILVPIGKAIYSTPKWEQVFILSCVAVSLDPLIFYIPVIDDASKCLAMDMNLKSTALILRSLTDIPLLLLIGYQVCGKVDTDYPHFSDSDADSDSDSDSEATSCLVRKEWSYVSIVINVLAIIPVPQVVIIGGFFRMRGSSTVLDVVLVLQYLPRVGQIYLSSKKFRMGGKWIKPALNMFLYLLASHVFGAIWYFFAIQTETSCWHQACRNIPGCAATFNCGGDEGSLLNTTALDQACPINSPNKTIYDFGIYIDLLQSSNTRSVNVPKKLVYCFWWGLKNLSNFGINLQTSTGIWENCFAIVICVCGLLLFLYLIGNMQKYMKLETTRSLKTEKARWQKIKAKREQMKAWMENKGVSADIQNNIKKYIKLNKVVEKNIKADVDAIMVKVLIHCQGSTVV